MHLAFDHLVHFVEGDPAAAAEELIAHGIHAVAGGRHERWGTHNALCYLDLSYLEFLALQDQAAAQAAQENRLIRQLLSDLPQGEGMGQVAFRTDDIEATARRLERQGLRVIGPLPGSRRRADGSVIAWQMLFAERPSSPEPLPFFIQWEQSDEERRLDLTSRGVIARHRAGDLRLACVAWAVRDLEQAVRDWSAWFGLSIGAGGVDDAIHARYRELLLPGGNIRLCAPLGGGSVQQVLDLRGERPFLAAVTGAGTTADIRLRGGLYRLRP